MNSFEKNHQLFFQNVAVAMQDPTWAFWGYTKFPRHGKLTDSFRLKWKVRLENRLFTEIICMNMAAQVLANRIDMEDVNEVLCSLPDDVISTFSHSSSSSLFHAINDYVGNPLKDWMDILIARIEPSSIQDSSKQAEILVGCAKIPFVMQNFVNQLRSESV